MVSPNHRVTTVVREIRRENGAIIALTLMDPDGWPLPPFTPGAHIDVHLPNGAVRQYSLCGDHVDQARYAIAVQREADGRGGSILLHEGVRVGDRLLVSLPRNHFALATPGHRHVLIGGGIGLTPIMSMVAELRRRKDPFELHACLKSRADMPFRGWLEPLERQGLARIYATRDPDGTRLDIAALVRTIPEDVHIYCCGPTRMIDALLAASAGRPEGTVHVEHFGAARIPPGGEAFTVELARSKRSIPVAAGMTILEALRESGVEIEASCEGGVCLTCKTRYLEGAPIHRDLVMKPTDRREFMTPCVSSCATEKLVLDL
jgi:vanillate O-demethylase ferredoxin subunit